MSTKLLVAGIALALLALRSEEKSPKPAVTVAGQQVEAGPSAPAMRRAFGRVGNGLEFVVAQSVAESLNNSAETLATFGPRLYEVEGETLKKAQRAADDVERAIAQARDELEKGRTFKALDHSMLASNRADDLRRLLTERR